LKYLSRNDLETIGGRVIAAYKKLPAISGQAPERVDIDYLCQELLGLRVDYARLSLNGEKIGLTSSCEVGVEIFPEDPSCEEEQYYIFALYLQGFSTSEIARELNKLNIPTKAGKEIWRPSRVAYILKNERYIGDSFYQKTYRETTVPFNQHPNRGQEDRFYAKGTHPGIVEKDVFDAAQTLIEKRKDVFAKATTQNIYPLTSRIQCSECGSFYRRRIVSGTVKWVCSLHKDDSTACDSNYYSEERIYDGFISMVNKLRFSEDNILGQVISRLEMTLAAMKRNNLAARDLSKSIAELNAKLLMLEQLRSKGYLAPEVYQAQANEIGAELAKLKDVRQEKFNSKAAIMLEEVKKLKMLIFELEEPLEAFDEKLFLEIVKSIQINKEDEMSVELLGGLRFRERI
jgi:site-specific DNA recombinase